VRFRLLFGIPNEEVDVFFFRIFLPVASRCARFPRRHNRFHMPSAEAPEKTCDPS